MYVDVSKAAAFSDCCGNPTGGTAFDDRTYFTTNGIGYAKVGSIVIRAARDLDAMSFTYKNTKGSDYVAPHGGNGGILTTYALAENDYINEVSLCVQRFEQSDIVKMLTIRTKLGKYITAGGCDTQPTIFKAKDNWAISFISGRSGTRMDQIVFYQAPFVTNAVAEGKSV
jgi:hypothetical protein